MKVSPSLETIPAFIFEDEVKKYTEILSKNTPINFFNFIKISTNKCHILTTHTKPLKEVLDKKLLNDGVFLKHPEELQEGMTLWENIDCNDNERQVQNIYEAFGIYHPIAYIIHQKKSTYIFEFGSRDKDRKIIDLYLNMKRDLMNFCDSFSRHFNHKLDSFDRYKFILKKNSTTNISINATNYEKISEKLTSKLISEIAHEKFINFTYLHNYNKLSKRQSQALYWLLKGKSYKETAEILSLSKRTVETYLDNLKIKLNCNSKIELAVKFLKNHPQTLKLL